MNTQENRSSAAARIELTAPGTDQSLVAEPCTLVLDAESGATCILYVGAGEADHMSSDLRNGTFRLPPEFHILPKLVAPGALVLDIGAHIGTFTIPTARSGYRVLAIEASPYNVALLRHNVASNGLDERVRIVHAAIGDQAGTVEFVMAGPYGLLATPHAQGPIAQVPMQTALFVLNDILAQTGWEQPGFIKLDVEGSEPAVLRGLAPLLSHRSAPPVMVESNAITLGYFGATPRDLWDQLQGYGYRCFFIEGNYLTPIDRDTIQPVTSLDILAVKQRLGHAWRLLDPPTAADVARRLAVSAADPHWHSRLHVARTLVHAPVDLLAQPLLMDALDTLYVDPVEAVRNAAAWWGDGTTLSRRGEARRRLAQTRATPALVRRATAWLRSRYRRFLR